MSQVAIIPPSDSGSRYVVRYYPARNFVNYYAVGFLVSADNSEPAILLAQVIAMINKMMIDADNGVPFYDRS